MASNYPGRQPPRQTSSAFFKAALPMIAFTVIGSIIMREFATARYTKSDMKVSEVTQEELLKLEYGQKKPVDLNAEVDRLGQATGEWESYENKPHPTKSRAQTTGLGVRQ
eukprot:Clim_evm68s236 gene=Clim_evmTU68s236